jgi:hypothetical protein
MDSNPFRLLSIYIYIYAIQNTPKASFFGILEEGPQNTKIRVSLFATKKRGSFLLFWVKATEFKKGQS